LNSQTKSYGLIFLFKWKSEVDDRVVLDPDMAPGLFFARQIIPNACATQAILSVLFNTEDIVLGESLGEFKQFTSMFDSETKGLAISNSDVIRNAHNSYSRPEPFVADESSKHSHSTEDAYHFIAYVPHNGSIYELDGLKAGPIKLGDFNVNEMANW
jgi:ubiquitin carboxyl-terminal hydrolase L5